MVQARGFSRGTDHHPGYIGGWFYHHDPLIWLYPLAFERLAAIRRRVLSVMVLMLLWVNVFWGLINLVPVYPLDGGSVMNVLVQVDPVDEYAGPRFLSLPGDFSPWCA